MRPLTARLRIALVLCALWLACLEDAEQRSSLDGPELAELTAVLSSGLDRL